VFNRLHITFAADASYNERVSEWFGEMSMLAVWLYSCHKNI